MTFRDVFAIVGIVFRAKLVGHGNVPLSYRFTSKKDLTILFFIEVEGFVSNTMCSDNVQRLSTVVARVKGYLRAWAAIPATLGDVFIQILSGTLWAG